MGTSPPPEECPGGHWQFEYSHAVTFQVCAWDSISGQNDCWIDSENVDHYSCQPGPCPLCGDPGGGGGGGGGGGNPQNPYDPNEDGKMDCWHDAVASPHPSKDILDENQELGQDYGGSNGIRPWHSGIDMDCYEGNEVRATFSGTVTRSSTDELMGNYVEVENRDGTKSAFAHLLSRTVRQGDQVGPGTVIGLCDSTGSASGGNHLHYEIGCSDTSNCFRDPETAHPCASQP